MTEALDLGLRIPVQGVQLIEASAGTGKTFTLATLYSRLVIEQQVPVAAILAVTFTEAATKELRARLRQRLVLAVALAEAACAGEPGDAVAGEETRLTGQLVQAAIAREGAAALRQRLRLAAAQMDLAPIHTIHGFCRRALADHALEAGQPLLASELLEDESALREEVALEFWRLHSRAPAAAATLGEIWGAPEALATSLRELLALDVLEPPARPGDDSALAALRAARERLASQFAQHGDAARELLRAACLRREVHASVVGDGVVDAVWLALGDWMAGGRSGDPAGDKLGNYGSSRLQARCNKNGSAPASPLFDAIEHWQACVQAEQEAAGARRIAMVHAARDFARARIATLKRERRLLGFDDMIRGVADALEGVDGAAFAQRLQAQYRVALLDEFQDTDARQWAIFRRLFAGSAAAPVEPGRALFLIGDPKQAIYRFRGGDVFTYLAAGQCADARHRLGHNFRSRPAMLAAVQTLFELSGSDAFAQAGIGFEAVLPGGQSDDAHWRRGGVEAAALTLLVLEPGEEKEAVEQARERATRACVAAIHALLADGLAGRARLVDRRGIERGVEPGDIAVLVEKNSDALRMHEALARCGIPSVAAGRSSLYLCDEAQDLRCLFEALLAPADDERLRAALAAPLFGLDALALAALDGDEAAHRHWQGRLQDWQQRAQRHGPGALLAELCAEHAPRLLALHDGERRLSNYLQLAEELQAADAHALGLVGLLAELERRIETANPGNDAELLRLESDARRVLILTLHKSKGLEFEFVFLPYAATNGAERPQGKPRMAHFHDGRQRVALLYPDKDDAACVLEAAEQRAEKLRLLYVGLTRARLASWVVWGAVNNAHRTPLAWLLHRPHGATSVAKLTMEAVHERAALLQSLAPHAIAQLPAELSESLAPLQFPPALPAPPAAIARRLLNRDWWVHSFSQLAREDTGLEASAADDEPEPVPEAAATSTRLYGPRFGNCLHLALEKVSFEKWLDCDGQLTPAGEAGHLLGALHEHGYGSEAELQEGLALLTTLIAETLNTAMPEGSRLAEVPASARRNEMEFHLALAPTTVPALLAVLHRHGIVADRQAFGLRRRLEGLLTGRIDLIYEAGGRFHVLDYKSNQLPAYDAAAMDEAVRHSEYDLQYVLYTLALHRWLRFRLGAGYDITQHLGGVRYLFCRGLDRRRDDGQGIHAPALPSALILELDALLQDTAP